MVNAASLVSVAMATYNGEKYITAQLESIVNQRYPIIEIVITDDASTDNTVSIIKAFQEKYSFIKLFQNAVNSGVTKTFEQSFKHCSGNFIAISDQDDIWELHKLETLIDEIGEEDAIYSNSLLVDQNGNSLQQEFGSLMNLRSYYDGSPFLMGNCVPGHTIVMKADFLKSILPLPDEMMFDRWISFNAAANNGIKYVDQSLVKYRQHESNTIGVARSKGKGKRETKTERFYKKLHELKALEKASIKNEATKQRLHQLLQLFHRQLSLARSIFFFKNINTMLVIKKKPYFRKVLYCLKMFFKPSY